MTNSRTDPSFEYYVATDQGYPVEQPVLQSEQYPRRYSVCTGTRSIFPLFPPYRPKLDEAKQACPSSQASLKKISNGSELRATRRYRPRLSMGTTRFAIGPIPKQLQRVYCHTLDFPPISPYIPPIAPAQPVYTVYTQSGTGIFLIWTPEFSTDSLQNLGTQNQPISRPAYEVSGRSAEKSGHRRSSGDAR